MYPTPRPFHLFKSARGLFCVFSACLVLALAVSWYIRQPADNPAPSADKAVHVVGQFPFDRGWALKYYVTYETANPDCWATPKVFGIFPQTNRKSPKKVGRMYVAQPSADKTGYALSIPFDGVTEGFCTWTAVSWGVQVRDAESRYVAVSDAERSLRAAPPQVADATYRCETWKGFSGRISNGMRFHCRADKPLEGAIEPNRDGRLKNVFILADSP